MYGFGERDPFFDALDKSVVLVWNAIMSPYNHITKSCDFFEYFHGLWRLLLLFLNLNVFVHSGEFRTAFHRLREILFGRSCNNT